MTEQTIVAVYDTPAHAELAVQDLLASGLPESAVTRHAREGSYTGGSDTAASRSTEGGGFWSSLFGGEPDHDAAVYDRSVTGGASAITVKVGDEHADKVADILESHKPIDIDERASSYGLTRTTPPAARPATANTAGAGETIQLSEERLVVGKRLVNKGGARIRRFVVEVPVEEQVTLREEKVTLERRRVSDGRPVGDAFSEKTIEMTESAEEAVVSKIARVVEEVALRKETVDRVETVQGVVRKEDVEIEQLSGGGASTTTSADPIRKPTI